MSSRWRHPRFESPSPLKNNQQIQFVNYAPFFFLSTQNKWNRLNRFKLPWNRLSIEKLWLIEYKVKIIHGFSCQTMLERKMPYIFDRSIIGWCHWACVSLQNLVWWRRCLIGEKFKVGTFAEIEINRDALNEWFIKEYFHALQINRLKVKWANLLIFQILVG